jgi:hypothetical protein
MTRLVAILALMVGSIALGTTPFWPSTFLYAQASATAASPDTAHFPKSMVGRWRAQPDRTPLSDDSAWGARATAVRLTEMRIGETGEGSVTVTRSVVNAAGRTLPGSRTVDTADFVLGAEEQPLGLLPRYTTRIMSAERRLAGPPAVTTTIDMLQVQIYPPDTDAPDSLRLSFSVWDGDGSFSTTLQRERTPTATSTRRNSSS